jgi:hypothetical protein
VMPQDSALSSRRTDEGSVAQERSLAHPPNARSLPLPLAQLTRTLPGDLRRKLKMGSSENSVMAKFAEFSFHELRRRRSELHTIRGRKRKLRIFEPSRGLDTPLTSSLKNPRFLCRPRVTILPSLQSRLKRLCSRGADSRRPKGPNRADNG